MTTPKERFLSDPVRVKLWNELTASEAFRTALDTALLELVTRTHPGEVYQTQAAMHRIDGAKKLGSILLNLGLKAEPPERAPSQALEHDDGRVPGHLKPQTKQP